MIINLIQEILNKLGNLLKQKDLAPIPLKSEENPFRRVRRY